MHQRSQKQNVTQSLPVCDRGNPLHVVPPGSVPPSVSGWMGYPAYRLRTPYSVFSLSMDGSASRWCHNRGFERGSNLYVFDNPESRNIRCFSHRRGRLGTIWLFLDCNARVGNLHGDRRITSVRASLVQREE